MAIQPRLDPGSAEPLYRQLHGHIERLIRSGEIAQGDRLPPTRELAGLLGLNRTTVAAAYALLESQGLISGRVGRGSFVTGQQAVDWKTLLDRTSSAHAPALAGLSFATSRPSEDLFPLAEFRETCAEVTGGSGLAAILQLGSPSGYEPLRQYLLEAARRSGTVGPGDDLMVTSGCQQALDLIARVLVRPGDRVAVEDPIYPGLKNLLSQAGAELIALPVGESGVDPEDVARVLRKERPKLVALTPNFQNPTGATLPAAAREAIARAARENGTIVVENDTYGDLRYEGEALRALKQLDDGSNIALLRSFSKITFPGLRVGWVIAPRPLIARMAEAKQLCDLHSDQLSQAVLLRFAESGRLEEHRTRVIGAGRERLSETLAACARSLPPGTAVTRPRGGMNLWVRLPEPLDAGELLPRAQRETVSYLPGKYFAVERHEPGALRLSFAGLSPELIRKGLEILGAIFSGELERERGARELPAPALV